jgi:hypothetical protein
LSRPIYHRNPDPDHDRDSDSDHDRDHDSDHDSDHDRDHDSDPDRDHDPDRDPDLDPDHDRSSPARATAAVMMGNTSLQIRPNSASAAKYLDSAQAHTSSYCQGECGRPSVVGNLLICAYRFPTPRNLRKLEYLGNPCISRHVAKQRPHCFR